MCESHIALAQPQIRMPRDRSTSLDCLVWKPVVASHGKHQTRRKATSDKQGSRFLGCLAVSSFRFVCILCYLIRQLTTRRIRSYLSLITTTLGLRIVYAAPLRPRQDCTIDVAQLAQSRPYLTAPDHILRSLRASCICHNPSRFSQTLANAMGSQTLLCYAPGLVISLHLCGAT